MANLKEIRNRISSVGSTMQITSAMKMVSAAKLKRAQDAITQMRPYASKLKDILTNLSATLDLSDNAYSEVREGKVLIVGVTSNRGLCGGFNNNVIKRVNELIATDYSADNVHVLCLGKKIRDVIKRTDYYYTNEYLLSREDVYADLTFDNVSEIGGELMRLYKTGEFSKICVVYNRFVNAATQKVETEQFLPVQAPESEESAQTGDYIFEPSKEEIVDDLIPKSLKVQLFKAILDSNAAEHGARMTAMHKATDNANELQKTLKLSYNKARQAAITNEILEIVGGAEALNS
ncbi:ATP synthase F1 subunit gamma [Crocinitomicaceae bacterium]|nr:ATP synthase F1 subunit gamma [Crocinitomicaceae bacterium]